MIVCLYTWGFSAENPKNIMAATRSECWDKSGPTSIHYLEDFLDKTLLLFYTRRMYSVPISSLKE
jgi:hypothetical protein